MKKIVAAVLCAVMIFTLCACGNSSAPDLGSVTEAAAGTGEEKNFLLTMTHDCAEDHPVHAALTAWAETVKEASSGTIDISIVSSVAESDGIHQLQAGELDMTIVSAGVLSDFAAEWSCLSIPYVFRDRDHLYTVMNSGLTQELYRLTESAGFVGVSWMDAGIRSVYTRDTRILTLEDLSGLRIGTTYSEMVKMLNAFGCSGTEMSSELIATAMQTGIVDGAEGTLSDLLRHAELTGYFCSNEHAMTPNIIVISSRVWNDMTEEQKAVMQSTATAMTDDYRTLLSAHEDKIMGLAAEKGVEFVADTDRTAFQNAVSGIYGELQENDAAVYALVERIRAA